MLLRGDLEGAQAEINQALTISPNLAYGHALLGATLISSGQPKEGITAIERAIRLDPHDPMLPSRISDVAMAVYLNREYDRAIEAAKRAIRSNPSHPRPYRWLAAALAQLGRYDEAKGALEKAMLVAPAFVDMYVRERVPWMRPEHYTHFVEGLRKAGWEVDRNADS